MVIFLRSAQPAGEISFQLETMGMCCSCSQGDGGEKRKKKGFSIELEESAHVWDYAVIQATPPEGLDPTLVFKQLMLHLKVCWNDLSFLRTGPNFSFWSCYVQQNNCSFPADEKLNFFQ